MTALRRATVAVTALGLLAGLLDGGQLSLAIAYGARSFPAWVTTLGSFVASPLLVAVTGYWVGDRVALSDRYAGLVGRFALFGASAVFVGYLLAFAVPGEVTVWRFLPAAVVQFLFASFEVPLYGLAGAAVGHFRGR